MDQAPSDDINEGDIVQLRSGGPEMTVLRMGAGEADLGWFTAVGEYRTGTLPVRMLVDATKARREFDELSRKRGSTPVGKR